MDTSAQEELKDETTGSSLLKHRITFDELLHKVGSHGRWQWSRTVLVEIVTCTMFILLPQFGSLVPPHRCKIPELESRNWSFQELRNITTPWQTDQFDGCSYYKLNYSQFSQDFRDAQTEKISFGDNLTTSSCPDGYIYDYNSAVFNWSYTMEYNLICDRAYLKPLVNSVFMLGLFFGLLTSGFTADRFGRRWSAIVSGVLVTVFGVWRSFSSSYIIFVITGFWTAFFYLSRSTSIWVWSTEIVDTDHRVAMVCIIDSGWTIFSVLLVGQAYLLQNWRYLNLSLNIPSLALPFLLCFMKESPRWLHTRGRYNESFAVLKEIAETNKKEVDIEEYEMDDKQDTTDEVVVSTKTYGYLSLIRTPVMRMRSLIIGYIWFTCSMVYYGFMFANVKLPGNLYLNALINNSASAPAIFIKYFCMKYFGRKRPLISAFFGVVLFSSLTCVLMILNNESIRLFSIISASIGMCLVDVSFAIAYVYTSELMPTVVRNMGTCGGSCCARVGGIVAPFINTLDALWPAAPNIIFAASAAIAAVLCFFLPETSDKPLPDTIEEVEQIET